MRAEAEQRAKAALAGVAAEVREALGLEAEQIVREGKPIEEIAKLIEEDQDIAVLVLAAGLSKDGPGPLVQSLAGRNAAFPVPVTVIPDSLSDADIDAVS